MSTRQEILDSLEARLQTITKVNGYLTDAGLHLYMWRKTPFTQAEYPALLVVDRLVERGYDSASISTVETKLTVEVIAIDTGADEARKVEEDVVKALGSWDIVPEEFDWIYVPKTELLKEENNAENTSIMLTVVIEYDATYDEI